MSPGAGDASAVTPTLLKALASDGNARRVFVASVTVRETSRTVYAAEAVTAYDPGFAPAGGVTPKRAVKVPPSLRSVAVVGPEATAVQPAGTPTDVDVTCDRLARGFVNVAVTSRASPGTEMTRCLDVERRVELTRLGAADRAGAGDPHRVRGARSTPSRS